MEFLYFQNCHNLCLVNKQLMQCMHAKLMLIYIFTYINSYFLIMFVNSTICLNFWGLMTKIFIKLLLMSCFITILMYCFNITYYKLKNIKLLIFYWIILKIIYLFLSNICTHIYMYETCVWDVFGLLLIAGYKAGPCSILVQLTVGQCY